MENGNCNSIAEFIVEQLANKQSIFLTGGAGVGKTFITREIINLCTKKNLVVQQCGTTGVSAIQLPNGRTLHSTFCLPVYFPDEEELLKKISSIIKSSSPMCKLAVSTAKKIDVLIIDEISMASAWLVDTLNLFLQMYRKCTTKPMGGITLLFIGDLLQLPPIYRKNDKTPETQGFLAIEASSWKALRPITVNLTKIKRQENDQYFSSLLHQIRLGTKLNEKDTLLLKSKENSLKSEDTQNSIYIAVRRQTVHNINEDFFKRLCHKNANVPNSMFMYKFPQISLGNKMIISEMIRDLRETLYLEENDPQKFVIGQRVMCISNINEQDFKLVNGDTGIIVCFDTLNINYEDDDKYSERCLHDYNFQIENISNKNENENVKQYFPVVCFDRTNELILITPKKFSRVIPNFSKYSASTYAFPLISCFAATTHKVQGCTLNNHVVIDCSGMDKFNATFYVALSRATELNNVHFVNYNGNYSASKSAKEFYSLMNPNKRVFEENEILQKEGCYVYVLL